MFVQTQKTPNPNSLKFLPGRKVSNDGPYEILDKNETNNDLIRNILSINSVKGIYQLIRRMKKNGKTFNILLFLILTNIILKVTNL